MQNLNINLVEVVNNQSVTTSLKIAEVFNKRHDAVLRSIKSLDCSEEFNLHNFAVVEYIDAKGEKRPSYTITRDGFTFLAMGFTGKKAAQFKEAYIKAFNTMEQTLKSISQAGVNTELNNKPNNNNPTTPISPPRDKDNFYHFNIYFLKIRYIIEDNIPLFLLNDIDNFLEVTKINGIDKERNKNNYTINHILYDYNIVPRGKYINNSLYLFLNLTQLIEFCYNYKTKRAELLENILTNRIIKYIEENHRTEIETKGKNIFLITA
ncbi:MAG: Rha family transcriptional regulator [Endomicrobium sp.]|jgi:Rha family phage regulatory protein|nr:Rha family transcriptional regulator [Endomicrobium sp.]